VGWTTGGSSVAQGIEALREALYEYYGAISELKMLSESQPHLASTVKIPDKPEALVLWEKCQALNLPLVAGGLIDQPHLWLEEISIVREVVNTFSMVK
jgi:hypothetical protein